MNTKREMQGDMYGVEGWNLLVTGLLSGLETLSSTFKVSCTDLVPHPQD